MPLIGGAIAGGVGLVKTVGGLFQSGAAKRKMRQLERNKPIYTRPDEAKQYLELAKTGANANMPGMQQAQQNLEQSSAAGMTTASDIGGAAGLAAAQNLARQEAAAYSGLSVQNAQFHQQNTQRLMSALQENAKYSDQEFEFNVNQPWQRVYNQAIAKKEAGQGMLESGLSGLSSAGMGLATSGVNLLGAKGGVPTKEDIAFAKSPETQMEALKTQARDTGLKY